MRARNLRYWTAWTATIGVCIASHARTLAAQSVERKPTTGAIACLDTLSLKPSKPMIVYIRAMMSDSTSPDFAQMADLFTQSVSQHVRHVLHAQGSVLPPGEPAITWRTIGSDDALSVMVHREGTPTFTIVSPHADSVAGTLLLTAAREAIAAGEGTFWPSDTPGDSMQFTIAFALPPLGQAFPFGSDRIAFPAFSEKFPSFFAAVITSETAPEYPVAAKQVKAAGVIVVDFDVDSTGHVVPESIRDVRSPQLAQLSGMALAAHNEFFESVRSWLPTTRFTPARIGGCPVRQQLRKPITFDLSGSGE